MIRRKYISLTTPHYEEVARILGKKYVRGPIESPFDFIKIASKGINAQIIRNFSTSFDIPTEAVAALLNVSGSTVNRWIRDNKMLERNYAVRIFELTDLFLYGSKVFENLDNFFKWIELPNVALGGLEPLELLQISGGISKVRELLGRIEYGVYS